LGHRKAILKAIQTLKEGISSPPSEIDEAPILVHQLGQGAFSTVHKATWKVITDSLSFFFISSIKRNSLALLK
jgi:hypothetical protein